MLSLSAESFVSSMLPQNKKIKTYRTTILPIFLFGCETWTLILREELRLGVLENRLLRRTFWPKRDEVTGKWKIPHNEELNDMYCAHIIARVIKSRMRLSVYVACIGRGVVHTGFGGET